MNIIHEITMDFCVPALVPRIHVVQGDSLTRQVAVTLLSDGLDWPIPAGISAAIRYRKPDGTGGSYDSLPDGTSAWSAAENVITFALAPQMLTVPGCVEAQAVLVSGTDILATFSFQLIVARDPSLDAIESEDYFNWLRWTQEQLDLYVEKLVAEGTFIGATPNLTIGTVTTLPAGAAATASITGTTENPVLNLGLPSGSAEGALMLGGGTMLGSIAMGGNKITGLGAPSDAADAVPLGWVLPAQESADHPGCYYRTTDGTVEWINPPMVDGVEYQTTQRFSNKIVYTKVVPCGTTVIGDAVTIAHGADAAYVIGCAGYLSNGANIPSVKNDTVYTHVYADKTSIHIASGTNVNARDAWVQIWYIKD